MSIKLIFVIFLVLLMLSFVNAVAVIVPVAYTMGLVAINFFLNIVLMMVCYFSANIFFKRELVGRSISKMFEIIIDSSGKTLLFFISTSIVTFLTAPNSIFGALAGGFWAALICGAVLFLNSYDKISLAKADRERIFVGILFFCFFVFIASTIVILFSFQWNVSFVGPDANLFNSALQSNKINDSNFFVGLIKIY